MGPSSRSKDIYVRQFTLAVIFHTYENSISINPPVKVISLWHRNTVNDVFNTYGIWWKVMISNTESANQVTTGEQKLEAARHRLMLFDRFEIWHVTASQIWNWYKLSTFKSHRSVTSWNLTVDTLPLIKEMVRNTLLRGLWRDVYPPPHPSYKSYR